MALTPQIRTTQAGILLAETATVDLRVTQAYTLTAINFPAEQVRTTQGRTMVAAEYTPDVRVTQARVLVAVRGRVANTKLRAWTFSLDGHDFYVLRLGDETTLVYDLTTGAWVDWASPTSDVWRPTVGINWTGAAALADTYGSDVLMGDDTYGLLWFLDPDQPYDQHPDYTRAVQELYFERITMGQVPMKGRQVLPCYAAWLTTDMGDPAYTGAGVTLEISDDAGATFDDMGTVVITAGVNSPELSWYSLGQIAAPGRLFKITDDGAVARIDGLEMNDPEDG